MSNLQAFKNSEFGELNILEIDGKEYFPATTCAKMLGYAKPHNAISMHCRYSLKQGVPHPQNPTKTMTVNFIPEGDLYRLIVHSKLPSAEKFEHWVFDEVLPAIRKQGSYAPDLTKMINQTVSETVNAVIKQLVPAIVSIVSSCSKNSNQQTHAFAPARIPADFYSGQKCKLETFPAELVDQVNTMLTEMQCQQSVNFSMISRFCTINGYTISSPAVKRYFDKHFEY